MNGPILKRRCWRQRRARALARRDVEEEIEEEKQGRDVR
jgi:hypothetical protein